LTHYSFFLLSLYQVQIFISQLSSFSFNFQIKSKLLLSFFFFDKSENPMLSFPGISVWGWRWWKPLKNCGIELRFLRGRKIKFEFSSNYRFSEIFSRIWVETVRNVGEWQIKFEFSSNYRFSDSFRSNLCWNSSKCRIVAKQRSIFNRNSQIVHFRTN